MNTTPAKTKIDWSIINWLRGFAALYVIFNHSRGALFSDSMMYAEHVNPKANWHWWEHLQVILMTHSGVASEVIILFFVISGFSMAHSLFNDNSNTLRFYKRRLIRLYPPYVVGIVWSIIVLIALKYAVPDVYNNGNETFAPFKTVYEKFTYLPTLLSNLFFIPKDNFLTNQYWTIELEVVFYLLVPFIVRYLKATSLFILAAYAITWFIFGKAYHGTDTTNSFMSFTIDYGIYFIVGIFFYRYKEFILRNFKLSKPATIIVFFIFFESVLLAKAYIYHTEHNKLTGIMGIILSYIMLFGAMKHNIKFRWLEKIGIYSYSLYATHFATIYLLKVVAVWMGYDYYLIHNMFFWYIGVAVCLAFGYVMYLLAERPSNRYLERLRREAKARRLAGEPEPAKTPWIRLPRIKPAWK